MLTFPVPGRDLVSEPLFEEDLVLVVPVDDDPLVGVGADRPRRPRAVRAAAPRPGHRRSGARSTPPSKPAGVRLRPRVELDGVRLLASLTFEGYGPAVLPATAVPPHLRPRFRSIGIDDLPPRHVVLAQRARGMPSAGARAVIQTLRSLLADPGRLPEGVRVMLPAVTTRTEGSLRVVGMPNG